MHTLVFLSVIMSIILNLDYRLETKGEHPLQAMRDRRPLAKTVHSSLIRYRNFRLQVREPLALHTSVKQKDEQEELFTNKNTIMC